MSSEETSEPSPKVTNDIQQLTVQVETTTNGKGDDDNPENSTNEVTVEQQEEEDVKPSPSPPQSPRKTSSPTLTTVRVEKIEVIHNDEGATVIRTYVYTIHTQLPHVVNFQQF